MDGKAFQLAMIYHDFLKARAFNLGHDRFRKAQIVSDGRSTNRTAKDPRVAEILRLRAPISQVEHYVSVES